MKMRVIAAVLGMALVPSLALGQDRVAEKTSEKVRAVRFGKLWDGKGKIWTNAIVIIDGDRVRELTTDSKRIPSGTEGVDLSKYYALPGLIDVHPHLTMYTDETPGC